MNGSSKISIFVIAFILGLMFLAIPVSSAAVENITERKNQQKQPAERCKFPGRKLLRSGGYASLEKADGKDFMEAMSTDPITKWMKCVGHGNIDKAWAERTLRRLQHAFLKMEGGREILTMSTCSRRQILEIYDPDATNAQAEKAGECMMDVFKEQDAAEGDVSVRITGVVRIDEDCERMKRNMINAARRRAQARNNFALAAGICCSATPFSFGVGLAWCGVYAAALAALVDALAELQAALEFECPRCSDDETERQVKGVISGNAYKKRFISQYNQFEQLPPALDAHQL